MVDWRIDFEIKLKVILYYFSGLINQYFGWESKKINKLINSVSTTGSQGRYFGGIVLIARCPRTGCTASTSSASA
jgi:hypothetical protein